MIRKLLSAATLVAGLAFAAPEAHATFGTQNFDTIADAQLADVTGWTSGQEEAIVFGYNKPGDMPVSVYTYFNNNNIATVSAAATGTGGAWSPGVYYIDGGTCTTQPLLNVDWNTGSLHIDSIANNGVCSVYPAATNASIKYFSGGATGWTGAEVNVTFGLVCPAPFQADGGGCLNISSGGGYVGYWMLNTQTNYDPRQWGAYGDGKQFEDTAVTLNSSTGVITDTTYPFSSGDVGALVAITNVNPSGAPNPTQPTAYGQISSFTDGHQVTASGITSAGGNISGPQYVSWGHDDTAAVQAWAGFLGAKTGVHGNGNAFIGGDCGGAGGGWFVITKNIVPGSGTSQTHCPFLVLSPTNFTAWNAAVVLANANVIVESGDINLGFLPVNGLMNQAAGNPVIDKEEITQWFGAMYTQAATTYGSTSPGSYRVNLSVNPGLSTGMISRGNANICGTRCGIPDGAVILNISGTLLTFSQATIGASAISSGTSLNLEIEPAGIYDQAGASGVQWHGIQTQVGEYAGYDGTGYGTSFPYIHNQNSDKYGFAWWEQGQQVTCLRCFFRGGVFVDSMASGISLDTDAIFSGLDNSKSPPDTQSWLKVAFAWPGGSNPNGTTTGTNGTGVYSVTGTTGCTGANAPTLNMTWTNGIAQVNSVASAGASCTALPANPATLAYSSGTATGWGSPTVSLNVYDHPPAILVAEGANKIDLSNTIVGGFTIFDDETGGGNNRAYAVSNMQADSTGAVQDDEVLIRSGATNVGTQRMMFGPYAWVMATNNAYVGFNGYGACGTDYSYSELSCANIFNLSQLASPPSAVSGLGLSTLGLHTGTQTPIGASSYTVLPSDHTLYFNQTGGSSVTVSLTLPAANADPNRELSLTSITNTGITSTASNVVALSGGSAGSTIVPLNAGGGKWVVLKSDGNYWHIVRSN